MTYHPEKLCFSRKLDDVDAGSRLALNEDGTETVVCGRKQVHFVNLAEDVVTPYLTSGAWQFHEIALAKDGWFGAFTRKGRTAVCKFSPHSCRTTLEIDIPDFNPYYSNAINVNAARFVGYSSYEGLTIAALAPKSKRSIQFDELAKDVGQVKSIAVGQ